MLATCLSFLDQGGDVNVGAAVGGIIGGLALLALVVIVVVAVLRIRKNNPKNGKSSTIHRFHRQNKKILNWFLCVIFRNRKSQRVSSGLIIQYSKAIFNNNKYEIE